MPASGWQTTTPPVRRSSRARAKGCAKPPNSPASAACARSRLDVTGAFHSPFMAAAQGPWLFAKGLQDRPPSASRPSRCSPASPRRRSQTRARSSRRALHGHRSAGARRWSRSPRTAPSSFIDVGARPGAREARRSKRRRPGGHCARGAPCRQRLSSLASALAFPATNSLSPPESSGWAARCRSGSSPTPRSSPAIGPVDEDWIERRTGIRERRYAQPGARLAELAARSWSRRADRRRHRWRAARPGARREVAARTR